jgi:hypothetical protein
MQWQTNCTDQMDVTLAPSLASPLILGSMGLRGKGRGNDNAD